MKKKQVIRLNENQLKNIVSKAIKRIVKEDRTFRFDNTPQGIYDKMIRYNGMIYNLQELTGKMLKLSGKSTTGESNDSIDSKVWNLANEINSLIEQYGLDYKNFDPDDYTTRG